MCVSGDMLGAAETVKLPTDHVIVDAQPQVLDVINEGDVSFGVFVATRSSVRDVLVAARSLANRVLKLCVYTRPRRCEVGRGLMAYRRRPGIESVAREERLETKRHRREQSRRA